MKFGFLDSYELENRTIFLKDIIHANESVKYLFDQKLFPAPAYM